MLCGEPNWVLLKDAAVVLTREGKTPFSRKQLIDYVRKRHPERKENSLNPMIQAITANAKGGAPGGQGKDVLYRIERGGFELYNPERHGSAPAIDLAVPRRDRVEDFPIPTVQEIEEARRTFEHNEPRDLFYRAATELVDLAIREATSISLTEAIAVLLQTWNKAYYAYRKFDAAHFLDIEHTISSYRDSLEVLRQRSIDTFVSADEKVVAEIFAAFEQVLGPVGAAKSLHLLAPKLFPLWDNAIAEAYGLPLERRGRNSEKYCRFMRISKRQCGELGGESRIGRNPLKAIDEYNYCKAKGWL